MGFARRAFSCLISSTSSQRPENFYSSVPTYEQYLRQKTWYWEKAHPHDSSRDAWRTCGPGCGRFRRGCVAVQQWKQHQYHGRDPLRTALWQRRPNPIGIGRYACMVLSPSHAKLSACVQSIKAATMKHGSSWISSTGEKVSHNRKSTIKGSS